MTTYSFQKRNYRAARFPGQYYDQKSGLNYNYFRDYDPQTGRFIESDPIGLRGGSFSTYNYGKANRSATRIHLDSSLRSDDDELPLSLRSRRHVFATIRTD